MRCLTVVISLFAYITASSQLNADFSAIATTGCTPLTVQFKDNSAGGPTQWFWDFGNGQTSSLQNPTVTYTAGGIYTVRLIIRTATSEDYKEKTNYITVFSTPEVKFSVANGDSGCAPLQSSFTDQSQLFNASVKSWDWDFGDGGTSVQQNPAHTFITEGAYNVSLTIQTTQGCSATYTINNAIIAGNKPDPAFSGSPRDGCASVLRDFKNKSVNVTAYLWDFGDGKVSNNRSPKHHYQDTGLFTVKLSVSENGCRNSAEIKNYMHVEGPVAIFNKSTNCSDPLTLTFRDISIAENKRLWDFGDGQTSTVKVVTHTYAVPGIYPVKLIVTGNSCNDTAYDTLHIKTGNPVVNILPAKNIYCTNDSLLFYITGYDSAVTKTFKWDFGDGVSTNFRSELNSTYYAYKNNNFYKPSVYVKYQNSCIDTVKYGTIEINGPSAKFSSAGSGCTNSAIVFKDEAAQGADIPLTQWLWSFGDGITSTTPNDSLNHIYSFPGIYNVNLMVTDASGCTDTITHPVEILPTPIVDAGADTFVCTGNAITLNPSGATSYLWNNSGSLSCTACTNPIATPLQSSVYFVTGTSNGCSASDSVIVKVQTKEFITAQPASYTICSGDSVLLNANGSDRYTWTPSNTLSSGTIKNPIASPAINTTYTVTGTDSNNCFADTAFVNVNVNPSPAVNIADSIVQLLTGSTYTIITSASNDAQNFEWLPATGLSCYNCLQPVASVSKTISYTVKVTNRFGCSDSDNITIISVCTGEAIFLPNTFSPNSDGMNDYFYPRSSADIQIKSLTIYNRWGQMVFQKENFSSNNYLNGWDGKYKNVLQNPDVYVYIMELQCSGSNVFIKKGNISLLR